MKRHVFCIWFWWVFYPFWYCPLRTRGVGFFLLNRQNLLSVTKVICQQSLITVLSNYHQLRWLQTTNNILFQGTLYYFQYMFSLDVLFTYFKCLFTLNISCGDSWFVICDSGWSFTNHILAENSCFMNLIWVNRTMVLLKPASKY